MRGQAAQSQPEGYFNIMIAEKKKQKKHLINNRREYQCIYLPLLCVRVIIERGNEEIKKFAA